MSYNWKLLVTVAAAVNVMTLYGCGLTQNTQTSSAGSAETTVFSTTAAQSTAASTRAAMSSEALAMKTYAVYELAGGPASKEDEDIPSDKDNQSGIKVSSGGTLTAKNLTVVTTGKTLSQNESTQNGLNAGVVVEASSKLTLDTSEVTTSGVGAAALFVTGTNASAALNRVKLSTAEAFAPGIGVTYSGNASTTNCEITTKGDSSPGVSSGIGGGTLSLLSGKITASGAKSPALYASGMTALTGTALSAEKSEAVVLDGNGNVSLTGVSASAGGANGVLIYRSSADLGVGSASFSMVSGSLDSLNGALFYVTNTTASINLNGVKITNASDTLLSAEASEWGNEGENGGNVVLTLDNIVAAGEVKCDMFSTAELVLKNGSVYTGAVNKLCSGKEVKVSLDAGSTWKLTGDSYVTVFSDSLLQLTNIQTDGYHIYYDKSNPANASLEGKTITLPGGGTLTPDVSRGKDA